MQLFRHSLMCLLYSTKGACAPFLVGVHASVICTSSHMVDLPMYPAQLTMFQAVTHTTMESIKPVHRLPRPAPLFRQPCASQSSMVAPMHSTHKSGLCRFAPSRPHLWVGAWALTLNYCEPPALLHSPLRGFGRSHPFNYQASCNS